MEKYYPTFLDQSGFVDLTDYCDLVRSKRETLVDKMVSIDNHEGNLTIVYDTEMIHYMDMAILNECFTELGDNGYNLSIMNTDNKIINVIGNFSFDHGYKVYADMSKIENVDCIRLV
jgi:hypothetical protein